MDEDQESVRSDKLLSPKKKSEKSLEREVSGSTIHRLEEKMHKNEKMLRKVNQKLD